MEYNFEIIIWYGDNLGGKKTFFCLHKTLVINLIDVYSFSGPNFNMWLIISTSTLLGKLCSYDLFHVTK
jgi:hypothetical protein